MVSSSASSRCSRPGFSSTRRSMKACGGVSPWWANASAHSRSSRRASAVVLKYRQESNTRQKLAHMVSYATKITTDAAAGRAAMKNAGRRGLAAPAGVRFQRIAVSLDRGRWRGGFLNAHVVGLVAGRPIRLAIGFATPLGQAVDLGGAHDRLHALEPRDALARVVAVHVGGLAKRLARIVQAVDVLVRHAEVVPHIGLD